VLLKRNLQQEVETLQSQLWLTDEICRSTLPRATQVTLVQPQVGAVNAQIANITNMLGDINAHAAAQSGVFTQDMVDEWNDFDTDATALTNITFSGPAFNMWKARRAALATLFGVDLRVIPPDQALLQTITQNPPPTQQAQPVAPQGQGAPLYRMSTPWGPTSTTTTGLTTRNRASSNTTGGVHPNPATVQNAATAGAGPSSSNISGPIPPGSDPNDTSAPVVPETGFTCEEPLLSQLLTAGAFPRNIALGNKTATVYIYENLVQPYEKFDGVKTTYSLVTMFSRFDEVHKAPSSQISYQKKVEAVFQCLDGVAKQSVLGFEGARTRLHYLQPWHLLFKLFGNRAQSISAQV
jgi:hypothetical protein